MILFKIATIEYSSYITSQILYFIFVLCERRWEYNKPLGRFHYKPDNKNFATKPIEKVSIILSLGEAILL